MYRISIISASVRNNRKSHWVALYFQKLASQNPLYAIELIDLKQEQFPLFEERLQNQTDPIQSAIAFSEKIKASDGVIIVTPEYNGGYPASLKNIVDLLYKEWKKKPIALVTVSAGQFGGTQVMTSLVFSLWKIGAWVVPAMFPVSKVEENYDAEGNAINKDVTDKFALKFLTELNWCMEANNKMNLVNK